MIDIQDPFKFKEYKYLYYGDGVRYPETLNKNQYFDKMTLYFLSYTKEMDTPTKEHNDSFIVDTIKILLNTTQLDTLFLFSKDFIRFDTPVNLSNDLNPPPPPCDGYSGTMRFDFKYRGNRSKYSVEFDFDTINNRNVDFLNLFKYLEKLKNHSK